MPFWATNFVFDDIPSETFNLICGQINGGGDSSSSAGSAVEIVEEYLYKRSKPYFYGTKFTTKLQFNMAIFSEEPIDRIKLQSIERWLFGHQSYKKLQILQCDMYDIYFNCILNEGNVLTVGNEVVGVECSVTCDAPWGWGKEIRKTYTIPEGGAEISFTNTSDDNFYLQPVVSFYSPISQPNVIIRNISDNNRETIFTSLNSGEQITSNSDLKTMTSNMTGIMDRFNGKYFRFLTGYNRIYVSGNLENFSITYTPARKAGS